MNILHISPYLPSVNAYHAGGVCMGKEIEALVNNNKVYVLTFISSEHELSLLDKMKNKNIKVEYVKINKFQRLISIIFNLNKPNFFAARSSIKFSFKLIKLIKKYNIEVIHAEYASMGQYLWVKKLFPALKFNLVEHDITIQSFRRKAVDEKALFKSLYYKIQAHLVYSAEKKYCLMADKVFVLNAKDKNLINTEYQRNDAIVLTPYFGIDEELSKGYIRDEIKNKENNICFMGQMGRPENYLAAFRLIKIFNNISSQLPNTKLYIIGNNPPDDLKQMNNSTVEVTGYVENVDEYISKCKIAVFPLTLGAGIKIKVLRSMALGIPVITTEVGAEGIDEDGETLLICHTDEEFEKNIINLLNNNELYLKRKSDQVQFVNNNFNWKKSVLLLNEHYS